jgi:hypothetical protein
MTQLLFCCAACIVATLGVAVKEQTDTVPFYLVAAAERPFAEFMMLVAHASVRAGIELKEIDNAAVTGTPIRPKGETKQVPREELVAAIHARKPGYQATWDRDVLLIRPVNGRLKFLDTPSTLTSATAIVGVMQSLRTIMAPLDPRLLRPAVGTGRGWEALRALSANITLDGSNGRTVIDTLNQVVLQNPGAWHVMTRFEGGEWRVSEFGFSYSDFANSRIRMPQKLQATLKPQ